ncbi:helix-turn-helix transcriptional regulator [Vibrio sp. 404]|uniref:Helix-turn-helix transcriptional regulator n=1 Tax=Vibrio marinisediminis TaxID=2758441 RepID=A0A7W2FUA0_9VIBR|nr:LuxR C-terminal-related transcriptional regulator [Vibrio marinisediminis]MBA5764360.1 helix-turn-helix transcriptional regulator [Vibrio marinisediminis]
MKNNQKQKILYIGNESLQNAAFTRVICSELNLEPITHINFIESENKPTLVLIDLTTDESELNQLKLKLEENPTLCMVILLNVKPDTEYSDFLSWPSVVGTFKASDSLEFLVTGIKRMIQGEIWISRELSTQLIHHFRGYHEKKRLIIGELTARQKQILKMILDGHSNTDISISLSISPMTAKTHVYNIYKKINVKNRAQATQWANKYLLD